MHSENNVKYIVPKLFSVLLLKYSIIFSYKLGAVFKVVFSFVTLSHSIFNSPPLQTPTQTLTPSSPSPTTTDGHHKLSLLAAKPPHQDEHFNHNRILKIHLKDSVEKNPSILSIVASLRQS